MEGNQSMFLPYIDVSLSLPLVYPQVWIFFKITIVVLAGVAQRVEHQTANQKVAGSILSQGTYLGCGPAPHLGACVRGNQSMFLSLSFSLPSPLSKSK